MNSIRIFLLILCSLVGTSALALPHLSIDLETGKVLSHQQAFDPWHPASLTKLMTAYVAFRAIQSGEITTEHIVRVSKNARRQPPSKMGYRTGTVMTIDNAIKLLVVKSANDIAVAIGESIAGSIPKFSQRMNREAIRLGMTRSNFVNPHGLHDKRQVVTARDMALLVQALHKEFPQYANLFSTPSVLAPSRTKNGKKIQRIYYSYNLLLERFRGGDGFKTGFVCASGYNFIGAATRSGRRIAAIVLGRDSQTSRAVAAAKLIEEGFRKPNDAGSPIAALKPNGPVPNGPRNMRAILCNDKARAARYEPGAGQAVIKSPWLQTRKIIANPLVVKLTTARAAAIQLSRVPFPSFRPQNRTDTSNSITTERPSITAETTVPKIVKTSAVLRIPLPQFRPGY